MTDWIKTKDRKPKQKKAIFYITEEVLFLGNYSAGYFKGKPFYRVRPPKNKEEEQEVLGDGEYYTKSDFVTLWMELPALPSKEETKIDTHKT